jgi:hypothetical protein
MEVKSVINILSFFIPTILKSSMNLYSFEKNNFKDDYDKLWKEQEHQFNLFKIDKNENINGRLGKIKNNIPLTLSKYVINV